MNTSQNMLLWGQRIRERKESGMTIEQWCEQKGISKHIYNYWNQRVRKNQKKKEGVTFAEVTSMCKHTGSNKQKATSDLQLFFKDIRIAIPHNFNKNSLADLPEVLRQL